MTVQNIRKELKWLQTVNSESELCPLRKEFDVSVHLGAYEMTSVYTSADSSFTHIHTQGARNLVSLFLPCFSLSAFRFCLKGMLSPSPSKNVVTHACISFLFCPSHPETQRSGHPQSNPVCCSHSTREQAQEQIWRYHTM